MMNLALDENKIMSITYKLNNDKCAEITLDNGAIVDINIVEKDKATKTIEMLVEDNPIVKKIREIISKDKELDDYVNKSRSKLAKNIIEYNQEWSVSPEEEEKAMEQYLNECSSGNTNIENNE